MKTFEKKVCEVQHATSLDERMKLAIAAVEYAVYHPTGYYASPEIEGVFLEAAQLIPEVKCSPQKGTILHVLTQSYASGGHSRVVQRWIDMSDSKEGHSIVLLNQKNEIEPEWLKAAVDRHNGKMIRFEEPNIMKRAAKLRQLAADFERVILHTHMDDPTALIAFGVESFTTPILLFNHADHLFWLGVSISDMVADMHYDHISYTRRNVARSYTLGIPCAPSEFAQMDKKEELRKELGIDADAFVLLSVGNDHKYAKLGSKGLCSMIEKVVQQNAKVLCYAIGPDMSNNDWRKGYEETKGKIKPLGVIGDKERYRMYLQAADLYLGSFPFPGYTAMMDAVQCGLPYLQLMVSRQQQSILLLEPNIDQSKCICYSENELVTSIKAVMNDKQNYNSLYDECSLWAEGYSNQDRWKNRLYDMYTVCPTKHVIYKFDIKRGDQAFIEDADVLLGFLYSKTEIEPKSKMLRRLFHMYLRIKGV